MTCGLAMRRRGETGRTSMSAMSAMRAYEGRRVLVTGHTGLTAHVDSGLASRLGTAPRSVGTGYALWGASRLR